MGSCKVDIYKSEYQWHVVNFSDIKAIKGLLKYRNEFDASLDVQQDRSITRVVETAGITDFNKEVICLYTALTDLIQQCNFSDKQLKILTLYQQGFNEEDIADIFNDTRQNIDGIINTCVRRIKQQNKQSWDLDYFYWNYKKTTSLWLLCSKCQKWKPEEYFYYDKTKQKYKSKCKDC